MRVVAQKYEYVAVDTGESWVLFDTVAQMASYTAVKSEEPNYLEALLAKWDYEEADFEITGFAELYPDWEALGYASGEAMAEDAVERRLRFTMAEISRGKELLSKMQG